MKKIILVLLTGVLTMSLFVGCQNEAVPTPPSEVGTTPGASPSGDNDVEDKATIDMLNKMMDMLGKNDAKVVDDFGEGTANFLEGTQEVISREFNISLFKEDVMVVMGYDDNKKVASSSTFLPGKELEPYKNKLDTMFGTESEVGEDVNKEEGSGKKSYTWKTDQAVVTLLQAYDIITLEIVPVS